MKQTNNLGLALYDATDKFNITGSENSLNHNMELIDEAVGTLTVDPKYTPDSENAQSGKAVAEAVKDKVSYISVNEFMLGENVLTADKIGTATNWTTDGNTFTHTSGSAEPLKIDLGDLTVAGDEWLVTFEFTTPITGDNLLYLSFGTEALTQTYNGTNSIAVALRVKENGDDLLLTPVSSFNGTLSNLKIQKIDKNGVEPYEFVTDSIITKDRQICKTGFWNIILGTEHTMTNAPNSSRTIVIGHNALRQLRSGNRNIAIGTFAMSVMESGEQNISIGADSMFEVEKSEGCISIGKGTMAKGKSIKDNIAIGNGALNGNANSTSFYNIAIGKNAGLSCIGERNTIIGYQCAMDLSQGIANVYIGDQCGGLNGKNQNTVIGASAKAKGSANRSIAIGYTAETTKENQCVLGGDNIVETLLKGNIVVRGADGVKRHIAFGTDGYCHWEAVSE